MGKHYFNDAAETLNVYRFMGVDDWYYDENYDQFFSIDRGNMGRAFGIQVAQWLDDRPAAEPTLDECLAALNRNEHRGEGGWHVRAWSGRTFHVLYEDELRIIGKHYIENERHIAKETHV